MNTNTRKSYIRWSANILGDTNIRRHFIDGIIDCKLFYMHQNVLNALLS